MDSNDVTAELTVTQQLLGGIAPAGPMITIKISPTGFYHSGGLGGLGQSLEPLSAEHVAEMLRQSFGAGELRALLEHIVLLRNAL